MTSIVDRPLADTYTSTGMKLFHHQEAMQSLRAGVGRCITTHLMPTDICQHSCAFCSVATRAGDSLTLDVMTRYLDTLLRFGLKSVIISGGGNPILYRCPETKADFNVLVQLVHSRGLDIGLITNGMPMRSYEYSGRRSRMSWRSVTPETLDKLTWVRISMSGLDHKEDRVFVPDVDTAKTTLGFSYVYHDIYDEPAELNHGKVSTRRDLITLDVSGQIETGRVRLGKPRLPRLTEQIAGYVKEFQPRYVRLLPNCLEPSLIPERCQDLQVMANAIDPDVVFVQNKPPNPHTSCHLGYVHPVLNSDGYVYPCDSVVLNTEAREPGQHDFGSQWRMCHWSEIASIYENPVRSLIGDPLRQCPGCVFGGTNRILGGVVDGSIDITPTGVVPEHVNFV